MTGEPRPELAKSSQSKPIQATSSALNTPPRTERAANDALDAEAFLNIGTMTTAALRAFQARDYDGAASKLKASLALIDRVKSRRRT